MAIGIDFGTTNCSIAYRGGDETRLAEIGGGREPYPSVLRTAVFEPLSPDRRSFGADALGDGDSQPDALLLSSFKPYLAQERLKESVVVTTRELTGEYDYVNQN